MLILIFLLITHLIYSSSHTCEVQKVIAWKQELGVSHVSEKRYIALLILVRYRFF